MKLDKDELKVILYVLMWFGGIAIVSYLFLT